MLAILDQVVAIQREVLAILKYNAKGSAGNTKLSSGSVLAILDQVVAIQREVLAILKQVAAIQKEEY